jgi:uncharacterized protein with PIN domain
VKGVAAVGARFRFHGELNAFLLPALRDREFVQQAGRTDTLKHLIESLGVPHTEVGRITVNGEVTSDTQPVREGEVVDVWPHSLPVNLIESRFVLDGHLGRLAAYLRMLGFDVWYERRADDVELARISSQEHRVLLTRDVGLLKRREVELGSFVHGDRPHEQLREVLRRFGLGTRIRPFTRCMECNGVLSVVAKKEIEDELPPHTKETKNEFKRCTQCAKIYWKGSHHEAMLERIASLQP